jgi:hypothetical protein
MQPNEIKSFFRQLELDKPATDGEDNVLLVERGLETSIYSSTLLYNKTFHELIF